MFWFYDAKVLVRKAFNRVNNKNRVLNSRLNQLGFKYHLSLLMYISKVNTNGI